MTSDEQGTRNLTVSIDETVSDLSAIDRHLADLYSRAAGLDRSAGFVPVLRTVLFNLIVFAETEQEAADAAQTAANIMGDHPCRTIVVDGLSSEFATASAVCGVTSRGDRRLCGEIIRVHARDEAEMAGLILPLLLPDVPVLLWMPGELPSHACCETLVELADRFIFDSGRFSDLLTNLPKLQRLAEINGRRRSLSDLSWAALETWREMTAQHFDPFTAREYLNSLTAVELRYAPGVSEVVPPQPLLFASWIVDRIGLGLEDLSLPGGRELLIRASQDGRQVEMEFLSERAEVSPGELLSVTIRCEGPAGSAIFVTRRESDTEIGIAQECPGMCLPPAVLAVPQLEKSVLVSRALESYDTDATYGKALEISTQILAGIRSLG